MAKNNNSAVKYSFACYEDYAAWNGDKAMSEGEYAVHKMEIEAKHPERKYFHRHIPLADITTFYESPRMKMNYLEGKWEKA